MMEVVVKIGAERRAKLQTNRHHQQINTQFFTCRISCFQPSVRALQETSHCFVLKTDCFKVSCLDHRVCGPHAFAASVVAVTTPPLLHCTSIRRRVFPVNHLHRFSCLLQHQPENGSCLSLLIDRIRTFVDEDAVDRKASV